MSGTAMHIGYASVQMSIARRFLIITPMNIQFYKIDITPPGSIDSITVSKAAVRLLESLW